MYKTQAETRAFFAAFKPLVPATPRTATSSSRRRSRHWPPPSTAAQGSPITIAAQNAYWEREGAFTGEISMRMITMPAARRASSAIPSAANFSAKPTNP